MVYLNLAIISSQGAPLGVDGFARIDFRTHMYVLYILHVCVCFDAYVCTIYTTCVSCYEVFQYQVEDITVHFGSSERAAKNPGREERNMSVHYW